MPDLTRIPDTARSTAFHTMNREELLRALEMFAKNWLAHDGCWFLAAEERLGHGGSHLSGHRAWQRFAVAEANRIMTTFNIHRGGGLKALETSVGLAAVQSDQLAANRMVEDGKRLSLHMDVCRVQETRRRKGLADFPCKSVGTIEFETFAARSIARIRTRACTVHRRLWKTNIAAGSSR